MNEWSPTCPKTRRIRRDNPATTRIGTMREGSVLTEVPGARFCPDDIFDTMFAALSLMNAVVNNGANDYSIE